MSGLSNSLRSFFRTFNQSQFLSVTILSFYSGLPYCLTGVTLQAWFATVGVDIKTIGWSGLVGLPYACKFLWAPFFDRFQPNKLGRRRSWILILQLLLTATLLCMSLGNPKLSVINLLILATLLAFFSASQDIVIDAYRTEILAEHERGVGVALTVAAYRGAIIISGALAMALAYYLGWHLTFALMAGLMFLGTIATMLINEPAVNEQKPTNLREAVVEPFKEFMQRRSAWLFLGLIFSYKLSDITVSSLSTVFLLKGMGFTLVEVATMNKVLGMIASILGAFFGGILLLRVNLYRGLLYFGVIQALAGSAFIWLACSGKVHLILALAVFVENFCDGIGTAAFFALLMQLCDKRYSATQYALFSALFGQARVLISPIAGIFQAQYGWVNFFIFSILIGLPGILLVIKLQSSIVEYNKSEKILV